MCGIYLECQNIRLVNRKHLYTSQGFSPSHLNPPTSFSAQTSAFANNLLDCRSCANSRKRSYRQSCKRPAIAPKTRQRETDCKFLTEVKEEEKTLSIPSLPLMCCQSLNPLRIQASVSHCHPPTRFTCLLARVDSTPLRRREQVIDSTRGASPPKQVCL